MAGIKDIVLDYQRAFNMSPEQWTDKSRDAELMFAQREFAKQARTLGYTWREIAKACGKKDHATMIKMCQRDGWRERNIKREENKKHDKNKRRI